MRTLARITAALATAAVRDELKPARAWPVVQDGLNRRF